MLTLYSFGPGANSLKPMLTLYEKGIEFEVKQLNPAKFEHHDDWFKKINPRGQVPALVDGDHVITESTVICEYLEDEHPSAVKLRPDDSYGKAEMRVWTKWVDEYFCWCVSTIGWSRMIGKMVEDLTGLDIGDSIHISHVSLPDGVTPTLGPDASAVGWAYQYALVDKSGRHDLADLRAYQDFNLRYALASVPGVAEVASVGGFVRQYQVQVDPNKLLALGIPLQEVTRAVRESNEDAGGRTLEFAGHEYAIRGRGYVREVEDLRRVPLRVSDTGAPVYLEDVATVQLGPDMRRGLVELDGEGEVVGGIVVMRYGENALRVFRDRYRIPIPDDRLVEAPFYKPADDSPEIRYMHERRQELGGYLPARHPRGEPLEAPPLEAFEAVLQGSGKREISTTMAFVRILSALSRHECIGPRLVPIVADEARTFGMDGLFRQLGIYASEGQLYEPVDHDKVMYYREDREGQILQEGINEAGAMSSWIAAGTAYANHGVQLVPFYIFYSMFGFQRIGDLAWAAGDSRARGFLLGGTSGRTTLSGEGLQHQDGHSHLLAHAIPNCVAYDPTYAYELAIIVQDGMRRMFEEQEDVFYYITVLNENYAQPSMPEGIREGVVRGMYLLEPGSDERSRRVQLLGGGAVGIPGGVHVEAPDGTPMANVMVSLMHRLGMDDVTEFGDSTGEFALVV